MMKNTKQLKSVVFLLTALLSMEIFTGCGGGNTTQKEVVNLQKGWYVRLAVESDTLNDNSTVFGRLQGAGNNKDRYDNEAKGSAGLFTTLYHEDFGTFRHYKSDYRPYSETGERSDNWTIKVNSSNKSADVTLSWKGITYATKNPKGGFDEELKIESPELTLMRLVDVETGKVMSVLDNDMKISFNMNGSSQRTFIWMLLKDGDPEPNAESVAKMAVSVQAEKSGDLQNIEDEMLSELNPPDFIKPESTVKQEPSKRSPL